MSLYSQLNHSELQQEIKQLEQQENTARQQDKETEADMYRQKKNLARSYLVDPKQIKPLRWFRVEEAEQPFLVHYLNGVMAWGNWQGNDQLIAIPIALIKGEQLSIK